MALRLGQNHSESSGQSLRFANPIPEGFRPAKFSVQTHKPFTLRAPFQPAGDQPEAIRRLVEGLNAGLAHQTLLGVTGSGKTFAVAHVIAAVQRPALVLAPNKTLAAQLYGEM